MTRVRIEKKNAIKLAYIEHVGAYDKIPFNEYIPRLYGWAKENHVRPGFYPMGLFLDPLGCRPPEEIRSEIGIQVYGEARPEKGISIKELPPMEVATISHKGPSSEYPKTYENLSDWITQHGYEWSGPAIEIYTRRPKIVGEETILYAKIEAPVRKLSTPKQPEEV
jgi:effector-binding domain-containing protein